MSACRNENVHLSLGLGITKGQIGQIKSHFVNRHLGSSQKVLRSRNGKIMMISIWISVTEQSLAMTLAQSLRVGLATDTGGGCIPEFTNGEKSLIVLQPDVYKLYTIHTSN